MDSSKFLFELLATCESQSYCIPIFNMKLTAARSSTSRRVSAVTKVS